MRVLRTGYALLDNLAPTREWCPAVRHIKTRPMNAATTPNTLQWAKLKFDPTEPSTTNPDWQAQHSTVVVFSNAQEHRVYFNPGPLSQLQRGDTVLCEYRRGKWRMARNQPPELMQVLSQRTPAPQAVATPAAPPPSVLPSAQVPPMPVAPMPTVQAKEPTSRDVVEIVGIFQELKGALPEAQETTVRAFASTLFMQRRKEDAEF